MNGNLPNLSKVACKADLRTRIWRMDRLQGRLRGLVWGLCLFLFGAFPVLAVPSVANVSFVQQPGTRLVSVSYDLAGGTCSVSLLVSSDNGATYGVPVKLLRAKPELQQARMTSATCG
jgi:hypothetical protein